MDEPRKKRRLDSVRNRGEKREMSVRIKCPRVSSIPVEKSIEKGRGGRTRRSPVETQSTLRGGKKKAGNP